MLLLFAYLALLWFGLTVLLGAWTLWFQAYIYSEPTDRIYFRAPIGGAILTLFFALWVWLDWGTDGRFRGLFEFSVRQDQEPYKEMIVETETSGTATYKLKKGERGAIEYRNANNQQIPSAVKKITVTEKDGRKAEFMPELDAKGKWVDRPNQPRRYIDKESGRYMEDGFLGMISTFRWWWLIQNLFVNLMHFAFWWAVLWLAMKFQFWHSFGMAIVAWLAVTLFVLPPLLNYAEETGRQRAAAKAA